MKFKINDDNWNIKVVDVDDMLGHRDDGDCLAGLCIPSDKLILIEENSLDFQTVMHELIHAHWSYLYLDDTNNILSEDFEEIMCGFFVDKGEKILKQAKSIYKQLQKGKR